MCHKRAGEQGTSSACAEGAREDMRKARREYASRRMAAAIKRMGNTPLSSLEWEFAFRWATVWGMASRMCPRCRRADNCTNENGCQGDEG